MFNCDRTNYTFFRIEIEDIILIRYELKSYWIKAVKLKLFKLMQIFEHFRRSLWEKLLSPCVKKQLKWRLLIAAVFYIRLKWILFPNLNLGHKPHSTLSKKQLGMLSKMFVNIFRDLHNITNTEKHITEKFRSCLCHWLVQNRCLLDVKYHVLVECWQLWTTINNSIWVALR